MLIVAGMRVSDSRRQVAAFASPEFNNRFRLWSKLKEPNVVAVAYIPRSPLPGLPITL